MKVAVFGAKGKVGTVLCQLLHQLGHVVVEIDKDDSLESDCNVAIDFSCAQATEKVVNYCKKFKTPLVCGTTGHTENQLKMLKNLKNDIKVVKKANFSIGFGEMEKIVAQMKKALPNWDVEIVETHKKDKLDKPSGSSKVLADLVQLDQQAIHSLRLGNCSGEHQVTFACQWESLTITHKVDNRISFALGAVKIAESIAKK